MLKSLLAAAAVASFVTLGACTQETRIEEDQSASEAIEDAGNELENAAEDAGNELEQASDDAADSVDDATDGDPNTTP